MAEKRKQEDCAEYRVNLCASRLEFVNIYRAKTRKKISISHTIQKIIDELMFIKEHEK